MKRLILALLLVLPALAWAGGVKITRTERFPQPAGSYERLSRRDNHRTVYEFVYIGSNKMLAVFEPEPLNYQDSTGAWKQFSFDAVADTADGYDLAVNTGRYTIEVDTLTGAMRYTRDRGARRGMIEFTPRFGLQDVRFGLVISGKGVKATYETSGDSLSWNYDYTADLEKVGSKGKGRVKDPSGKIKAEVSDFVAWDATKKPMQVSVVWGASTLTAKLASTAGFTPPFTFDPTITDTTGAGYQNMLDAYYGDAQARRDTTVASYSYGAGGPFGNWSSNNWMQMQYNFILGHQPNVASVDSAFIVFNLASVDVADTLYLAHGNWKGAIGYATYNSFNGYAKGVPWTFANLLVNGALTVGAPDTGATRRFALTAATRDSIANKMNAVGDDSLRMVVISADAYRNRVAGTLERVSFNVSPARLLVYYTAASVPTVVTVGDTLKPAVLLVGNVTIAGTPTFTSRGFKYWPSGAGGGDTVTVTQSGLFTAGPYAIYVDSLPPNKTVLFKAFAGNAEGLGWGALDSFSTTLGANTSVYVDGRLVTHVR